MAAGMGRRGRTSLWPSQPGQLCPLPGTDLQPLTPRCRGPPWPCLSGERQALCSPGLVGPPSQGGPGAQGTPTRARMRLHASRQRTPSLPPQGAPGSRLCLTWPPCFPAGPCGASWLYGVAGGPVNLLTYSPTSACEGASSSSGTLSSCSSLGTISSLCLWPKASVPDYSTSFTLWSLTTHGSLEPACVETVQLILPVQLPGPLTEGWLHYIIHDV